MNILTSVPKRLIFGSSRYPWDYFSKKHTGTAFFDFGMPVLLVFKCFCWPRGIPKRCFEESVCFLPSPESLRAPKTAYQTWVLPFWYAFAWLSKVSKRTGTDTNCQFAFCVRNFRRRSQENRKKLRTQNPKLPFVSVLADPKQGKHVQLNGHKCDNCPLCPSFSMVTKWWRKALKPSPKLSPYFLAFSANYVLFSYWFGRFLGVLYERAIKNQMIWRIEHLF